MRGSQWRGNEFGGIIYAYSNNLKRKKSYRRCASSALEI